MSRWSSPICQWVGALDPSSIQVDERQLVDRLSFAANYGRLINYYDQQNRQHGHWEAFFLKDPMILLASISQTDYRSLHKQFLQIDQKLNKLFAAQDTLESVVSPLIDIQLKQLFGLTNQLFFWVTDWLKHLDIDPQQYQLKTFIKYKVSSQLLDLLRQSIHLQAQLSLKFEELSQANIQLSADLDNDWLPVQALWEAQQRQSQEIQSAQALIPSSTNGFDGKAITPVLTYREAKKLYRPLFQFVMQVVKQAASVFTQLEQGKKTEASLSIGEEQPGNHYPDTALLIAFAKLMEVQQAQLNQMTVRHLDFYYRDLLKQQRNQVIPDQAILCLSLAKKASTLRLPKGLEFNGGISADKQAIIFVTDRDQDLNQIQIQSAQTLYYRPKQSLVHADIDTPNTVKTNAQKQIQTWPMLGASTGKNAKTIQQGFAWASPLLFLQGGRRQIRIHITLEQALAPSCLYGSKFWLSTSKAWLPVTLQVFANQDTNAPPLTPDQIAKAAASKEQYIGVLLDPSAPSIEPMAKNPDGYQSQWPLLKCELSQEVNLLESLAISDINIATNVSELTRLGLYSNSAKLPQTGFQPFGPIVNTGNRLVIASQEWLAKPLSQLSMAITWDHLPSKFSEYYQEYNQYLADNPPPNTNLQNPYFSNGCFEGSFGILQQGSWADFGASSTTEGNHSASQFTLFGDDPSSVKPVIYDVPLIIDKTTLAPQPSLLVQPFAYSDKSQDGFIKLQLQAPSKGFGFDLYSHVVTHTTMKNAKALILIAKDDQAADEATKASVIKAIDQFIKNILAKVNKAFSKFKESILKGFSKLSGWLKTLKKAVLGVFNHMNSWSKWALTLMAGLVIKRFWPIQAKKLLQIAKRLKSKKVDTSKDGIEKALDEAQAKVDQEITDQFTPLKSEIGAIDPEELTPMPNMPISPKVAKMSLTYQASSSLKDDYPFECYHYASFATYCLYSTGENLPNLAAIPGQHSTGAAKFNLYAGANLGTLYLQLTKLLAPSELSLYVELAPQGQSSQTTPLDISYLSDRGWQPMSVLDDATDRLTASGIIKLKIEEDISDQSMLMPPIKPNLTPDQRQYWIAISNVGTAVQNISVAYLNSQAITVVRQVRNTKAAQLPNVPAKGITKTTQPNPSISAIAQPFSSFGGAALESTPNFYQRVSARIKHKDRAQTLEDYELLALTSYPQLYGAIATCPAIGKIELLTIPKVLSANDLNGFLPWMNGNELKTIQGFIQPKTPAFIALTVSNMPHRICSIGLSIRFTQPQLHNELFQQLCAKLRLFLAPWIDSDQSQISYSDIQINNALAANSGTTSNQAIANYRRLINEWLVAQPMVAKVIQLEVSDAGAESHQAIELLVPQAVSELSMTLNVGGVA